MLPLSSTGMGAPNISNYYKAALLDPLKYWCTTDGSKLWHIIEQNSIHHDTKDFLGATALGLTPPSSFLATVTAVVKLWTVLISIPEWGGEGVCN